MKNAWINAEKTKPQNDKLVDVFVRSKNNPKFGYRITDCCYINNSWSGVNDYSFGVYVAFWMPIPESPDFNEQD